MGDTKTNRRLLLKATMALPAIYTLPSGRALAASSFTCADDPNNTRMVSEQPVENSIPGLLGPVDTELVDSEGNVYTLDSNGEYVDQNGQRYYFNGLSTMAAASCWASIGPVSNVDFW